MPAPKPALELIVDRWSESGAPDRFRWSLWEDGRRVAMGGPHRSAAESEAEATALAGRRLGRKPDRVTRL